MDDKNAALSTSELAKASGGQAAPGGPEGPYVLRTPQFGDNGSINGGRRRNTDWFDQNTRDNPIGCNGMYFKYEGTYKGSCRLNPNYDYGAGGREVQ